MNVHGPKFHRSQHADCRLVFHKPVFNKNTFILIFVVTLTLAVFALRTGAAASPKLVAAPGSLTFGKVAVEGTGARTVTLTNSGITVATISRVSVSGEGFSISKVATPLKLSVGQSISLEAHFTPVTAGEATGSIAITSNASDPSLTIALSGMGVQGRLSATPASASFGDVVMGDNDSKAVRLSNTGTSSLTISRVSVSGRGFSMSTVATPLKLSVGQSISLEAHFAPVITGEATGSIAITSNASDPSLTIALSGIGVQGRLSATPASASYGDVVMGDNDSKAVRLSNTGTSSLTISRVSVSGRGFSMSTVATPLKLSVGQSISLEAHFAPVTTGEATGSIAITSNASDPSLTIALSGIGVQGRLSATPASASYGDVVMGDNDSKAVRLSNTGTSSLTISRVSVSGRGFSMSTVATPLKLSVGQSISLEAHFAPVTTGEATGSIAITSNASDPSLTIALSGIGVQGRLSATPASASYGDVVMGDNDSKAVRLSNTGTSSLTISRVSVSGRGFSMSTVATPLKLSVGQSISLEAHFAPVITGEATGSIAVTSNASDPSLTIALSGIGVQGRLSATPASASYGDVVMGDNDSKAVRLSNTGTSSLTISRISASGRGFSMSTVATPLKLLVGQSISLEAHFAPVITGEATGSIAVTSNASDPSLTIGLSGIGVQGRLSATPASASFGDVVMGDNDSKTVTLSNTERTSVTISHVSVSGRGFSMSTVATPLKLLAGQSISLQAHFTPVITGEATGSIAITSNASDPSLTIALSGIGVQGRLSATPASASFGDVVMGDNDSKAVRLSNTGTSSLTISRVSVSGRGFSMSTVATPLKLSVGQSISLEAHFAPVTTGEATGSIAVTSNASDPSLTIGLSGIGVQGRLSATPASTSLGKVVVGENNSQTIRLSNTGDVSVTISRVNVSGSDFKIAGLTVPTVIASGKSATFNVLFTPISSGSVTGAVSLISDAPNSPLTISLSGTGVAATPLLAASPSGLNFGTVNVDSTSSLSLTLTNRGNVDVTISKVAVSGAGFSQGGVAAGTILGPDQSTTLRVAFAPVSAGSVNGDVAVTSNATTSPMMISLSGTAVQPVAHSVALAWDASKSSGVIGYDVYRGTASGGPYTKLTPSAIPGTQYTDTGVEAGHIYYYVVTSVDSSGVESGYSSQVSVSIPAS